jgi:LmbE family N-acetylglucosaminyl deacetylase
MGARTRRRVGRILFAGTVVIVAAAVTGAAVYAVQTRAQWWPTAFSSPAALAPSTSATPLGPALPGPAPVVNADPVAASLETTCEGETVLSVWAHYDDDLIFANPTLQNAISNGSCVRTAYVTAGDGGLGASYVKAREFGILKAYNVMRASSAEWTQSITTLPSGVELTQYVPVDATNVSVLFFHLPDGGLKGKGFRTTGSVTIRMLLDGRTPTLTPVGGGAPVTSAALTASISDLITMFHPSLLATLVPSIAAHGWQGDHPDHSTVGTFTREAAQKAGYDLTKLRYFEGYPARLKPANITGAVLTTKLAAYRAYASNDKVIGCATDQACLQRRGFGTWVQRQYSFTDAELFPGGATIPLSESANAVAVEY